MEIEERTLDSPWWNSQIRLGNSEWLAENVDGLDQSIKEMLLLIESGDFPVENVDGNHSKQSELVACVKEISQRHHLLADHYNKLTGELSRYIQSTNETKNYEKTTLGPQPPFVTPEKKLNVEGQVVGSDFSLSSGGGISDATPNEGSESSSLSSDSDSEAYFSSRNEHSSSRPSAKMLKHDNINLETEMEGVAALTDQEHSCGDYEMLLRQITNYEKELKVSKEKFKFAEEEIAKLKSELQNNEAVTTKMVSLEAQLVSEKNQIKLHEAEIEKENKKSLMLHRQVVDLEAKLESEKRQVQELQESVIKYTAKLSDSDLEIRKLNAELQDASGNFALEKWQLESSVSKLSERLALHEAVTKEMQMQYEFLAGQMKKCEAEKLEMEKNQLALKISLQVDIENLHVELFKKELLVDTLNKDIDGLKLKYDTLMAEKDGLNSKLQTLTADLSVCDNQIQHLEHNLHELHSENKRLSEGSDRANKLTAELKSKIDELQKEVEIKAAMISETAEEKREAIRQLCFSVDHYKSAYAELRHACVIRKRPTAAVL
ncbi:protein NETWORKED 4B [Sesamum indicum]|uniref:Protein NETWORKED 4B n=1 Tax=Sesamum indicum TaxID=4182 RepID=A0A8M8V474_SESIN|nr:protein NETWORKED 4B [Sesamum indicum]